MSALAEFDASPSLHMAPDRIRHLLGIRGAALCDMILANRFLRRELDARLAGALEPLPPAEDPDPARLHAWLTMASPDEISAVSRLLVVLINHRAVLRCTDGAALRHLIEWSGRPDAIDIVRASDLPRFEYFPVLGDIAPAMLDTYAVMLEAHLLGLLPVAYAQRLSARFPADAQPKMIAFPSGSQDQILFRDLVLKVLGLLTRREPAHA